VKKSKALDMIIDTREQIPLEFKSSAFDSVSHHALSIGDYAAKLGGDYIPLRFERKSFGDLFGSMTHGYSRFKKRIIEAKENNIKLVLIIEGTMRDVVQGYEHSQFSGDSMLKKLFMMWVRYDVYPVFCDTRRMMSRFIEESYDAVRRNWSKSK
jgi:ERCC4-type nuclease